MVLASSIVKADEGKPVTIDSANNRVKIAGDGDIIFGYLRVVEDRDVEGIKVGTIAPQLRRTVAHQGRLTPWLLAMSQSALRFRERSKRPLSSTPPSQVTGCEAVG